MRWFQRIISKPGGDMIALGNALEWFEKEHEDGRKQLKPSGRLAEVEARLPANAEYYYGMAMEIEAILQWINLETEKMVVKWHRHYLESYHRDLNANVAKSWAECHQEVVDLKELAITVGLIRSKFHGLTQGLNYLHFQLGNITALHKAGIEDHEISL